MNESKNYKCLIVEDEPIASEIIESYLSNYKEFQLVEICHNAINAASVLKREPIDLIFLDLHLPVLRGFDFLKKLENPPAVIITTAYAEYALEGFALDVVDYLLKPISRERFKKAIEKFKYLALAEEAIFDFNGKEALEVNFAQKKIRIVLNDILFIESSREYVKINTKKEVITIKMPISKIEKLLDQTKFQRVHKSFIVALDKISTSSSTELLIEKYKIPVGRKFKMT
ncbi:MAG: LytTR family DNA-binding domain-containing protein [Limnohabitans sp.]|nr:LytTR family DNA-binding domain-containing protein [Limnohabitans sp.]